MDDTLARVATRVAERFPADLERIRDYLRMPSVSATGDGDRRQLAELAAGYVGPGGRTIVPSRAVARVDIRLVGGDPETAAAAVRRHLGDHGFGHAAGAHGPDEYATLAGLQEHIVGAAAFLLVYADLPR
jgi:acetylornithine deacetylase/succinyl-diaminopimelate desuccinylase-like protein